MCMLNRSVSGFLPWTTQMKRILLAACFGFAVPTYAFASPVGDWLVADRSARVAIAPCGLNLCGSISWSADGGDVGQPILLQMKPDGQRWTGTVVDVRDGNGTSRTSIFNQTIGFGSTAAC